MIVLIYLLVCLITGFFGAKRHIGFALTFILAIFITPPIMALVLLITGPKKAPSKA